MSHPSRRNPTNVNGTLVPELTAEEAALVDFNRRFDLRNIIGLVFVVYGAILLVMGVLHGAADRAQASGLAINTWTGAVMLVVGAFFFFWAWRSPVSVEDIVGELHKDEGTTPPDQAEPFDAGAS